MIKKCLIAITFFFSCLNARPPKLTVVFIIDQFAYNYFYKLEKHFRYGLKRLRQNGVNYEEAFHPHGVTATAVGHASLSTGCLPSSHGFVNNKWPRGNGQIMPCSFDFSPQSKIFGSDTIGASSKNLMVDTLSDQFLLHNKNNVVYSMSYKPRAAIALAGKTGKAIWYDEDKQVFTSSSAYFKNLPAWLTTFNKKHNVRSVSTIDWQLAYPKDHEAYEYFNPETYNYSSNPKQLAGKKNTVALDVEEDKQKYDNKNLIIMTPQSNTLLLNLYKENLNHLLEQGDTNSILVWVAISNLDKTGHPYGPDSLEIIDSIYHLDKHLEEFMNFAEEKVGKGNALFALSSDHGVCQIPELLKKQGFDLPERIHHKSLTKRINKQIHKKYGFKKIIAGFKSIFFYLNKKLFAKHTQATKKSIINDIKGIIKQEPGIKKVWERKKMAAHCFQPWSLEACCKHQLYKKRTGDLICLTEPYSCFNKHKTGAAHKIGYSYNQHVPVIFYRPGVVENKKIYRKVFTQQFSPTLAKLMEVPTPSAAQFDLLPGITD